MEGEIDHRDIEKRRESEGGYREEVSASAMEPVCPVSRKGVRVRVRKWDVHIHCDQQFQSAMFEISVCLFD